MIEDPNLTRQILEYFARDDVGYSANKTVDDIATEFHDIGFRSLEYHVLSAGDSNLLKIRTRETSVFAGVTRTVVSISGLTDEGRDCVRDARGGSWEHA